MSTVPSSQPKSPSVPDEQASHQQRHEFAIKSIAEQIANDPNISIVDGKIVARNIDTTKEQVDALAIAKITEAAE